METPTAAARSSISSRARRTHEFWQQELAPQGFKLGAQILNFPGGVPGDVGIFRRR